MVHRVDHRKDLEWWRAVALHLRSSPKLAENLGSDALKANLAAKLENLARFCDHEADHCQDAVAKM